MRELNPVLLREVRARWRKWPTFAIVFGYAILLVVAIGWMMVDVAGSAAVQDVGGERTASLGYQLFEKVSWVQVLGWMLLAPVLAASAIAGEREQGLLDGLYLSSLTPRQILRGKLLSVLWFIGLMLLVPLPVIALCFQLGGVSPQEFLLVMVLNATTALTGTAIGLNDSAHARTTSEALKAAIYHLFLWAGSSAFCCCIGVAVSPIPAMIVLVEGDSLSTSVIAVAFTMPCQFAMTAHLLRSAQKALLRPLPEEERSVPGLIAPATPIYQVPLKEVTAIVTAPTARPASAQPNRYGQNFFFSRLRISNPILQFELNRRMRIRNPITADAYNAVMTITLCYAIWLFAVVVLAGDYKYPYRETWLVGTFTWLALGVLSSAAMGAATFSRDREQLMLEPLLLSPLSNASIVGAKLGAILIVYAAHALVLMPAMLPCIRSIAGTGSIASGISLAQAAMAVAIVTLAVMGAALLGMCLSWLCRRTFVATGWTLSLLLLLCSWSTLLFPPKGAAARVTLSYWNPIYALDLVLEDSSSWLNHWTVIGVCILILALVNAILLTFLFRAMRHRARVKERTK